MNSRIVRVLVLLLLGAVCASAQGTGSIVGTVTDPSGSVIAGAKITATDAGTGAARSATSNGEGYYIISLLRPSQYNLSVSASGFRTYEGKAVTLLADQNLTHNVRLAVGAANEVVEVSGGEVTVDTTTSTIKQTVESRRITELPLNGRNAAQLTLLVAGAVQAPNSGADQGTTKTFPGAVTISANGARQNQISYQLDGGNYVDEYTNVNQPFPFPDALQEFSVQTSNYSAEFGQNAGGVVNVVTKSGTNAFHGNVFEFVRNEVFNAKQFQSVTGRDKLKRNQFGGTFGGPVIRDKVFFFAGYQGTRHRNLGAAATTVTPSAAQRLTVTDPAVANLLKGIPVGDANGNVTFVKPDHQDFNDLVGKTDINLGKNDRFAARYTYDRFSKLGVFDTSNFLTYVDGSTIVSQNILLNETHVFSGNLVNAGRFSFSRDASSRGPGAGAFNVGQLGVSLPWLPVDAIQAVRVSGGFSFGDNPNASFVRNNFTWSDDVSWIRGAHDIRFGGVVERSRVDLDNKFFQVPEFQFANIAGLLAGKLATGGGNPGFRQGAGEFKNHRNTFMGFYFQDNWKLHRRLTVNLGLRWDSGRAWRDTGERWTGFSMARFLAGTKSTAYPNAPAGMFFPGDAGFPDNGMRDSMSNFAPRLGFAWDVMGDGKMSVRGGGGMFYDTRIGGMNDNRIVDSTPFSPQLVLNTGDLNPGSFSDPLCTKAATQALNNCTSLAAIYPFPPVLPPTAASTFRAGDLYVTYDTSRKWMVPTIYNWNLSVERQLPGNTIARVGYVGSHTSHLVETINLDPFPVGGGPFRRLNVIAGNKLVFGDIQQSTYDIDSSYHSLQVSGERRMSRGLTLTGAYTWSNSIDDLPPGTGLFGFDGTYSARPWDDPLRHVFDRGPSEFDHKHRFVASYVYQLPFMDKTNGFVKAVFGGWQLSGVMSTQTGRPLTLVSNVNNSGTGLGQDLAQYLGGEVYAPGACTNAGTKPCRNWINPAVFSNNPAGTFGNVGKGQYRFPGMFQWDTGLHKDFTFTERARLQFRAEFFNVLNKVNWDESIASGNNFVRRNSAPASGIGNATFGALTTQGDGITNPIGPRIGQLALKLFF